VSPALIGAYAPDPTTYRPSVCPDWVDEIDLTVSDRHVRMGTRALPEGHWLGRDDLADSEIALRRRLLAEQRDHVFACTPHADEAAYEAAAMIDQWLQAQRPLIETTCRETHPLARVGSVVQEDICLMVHRDSQWHLEGAMLCFPSTWNLAEKLGRSAMEVHQPVPHYAEELSQRVDTFFDRMTPDKPVWRRNFSLWPACLLWVPHHDIDPMLWDAETDDPTLPSLWIRSERQTLRRLPDTGAILFTIRVQMAPLSVLAGRPDRAASLSAWLRSPSGESRRAQLGSRLQRDLHWLDHIGST
jgi:hypothetical protein